MNSKRSGVFLCVLLGLLTTPAWSGTRKAPSPSKPPAPVPTSKRIPTPADSVVTINGLRLSFSLYLWQDLMPVVPPGGPPFHLSLEVTVKNQGNKPVNDFRLEKLSLYYDKSKKLFWTFRLASADTSAGALSIPPGAAETFAYSPANPGPKGEKIKEGTRLYGRAVGRVNGRRFTVSLPSAAVNFTY